MGRLLQEDKQNQKINELKKEYLWRYQECVRSIRRNTEEIAEIRSIKMGISATGDGMPRGSKSSDLSGYVAQIDGLERKLNKDRYKRINIFMDVRKAIDKLSSQNEKDVLFYRYIKGMDWWEIAEKMRYSERQIHRFHGKALANLNIPQKDVSECQ